jgi:hypothetical protein
MPRGVVVKQLLDGCQVAFGEGVKALQNDPGIGMWALHVRVPFC